MNAKQKVRYGVLNQIALALFVSGVATATIGGALWLGVADHRPPAAAADTDITVYKNRDCGCCHPWIEHLEASGLTVAVRDVEATGPIRSSFGVPDSMASCHTAIAGNYWVEGHVPVDLVERLLAEKPADIAGIAVPGMPIGSPGMEGPNPVTYDVVAYGLDGNSSVYATREGFSEVLQ
jgi:hypothetical protein